MDIPKEFGDRFERVAELVKRPSCVVFKGNDRKLSREVAIKVYIDKPEGDAAILSSFEDEIARLRAASHHALVPIIAGGESGGFFYIAMELINGPTLREKMKEKNGPLELELALSYVTELAAALAEIHEQKSVHGHIDSRGILFKGDKIHLAGYYPMTIDRISKNTTMADGRMTIDPVYIAPEQIEKPESADGRADIYALSVLLFELVTGTRPFSAKNPLQLAMMRLSEKPPSPAKLNSNLSPLLDAAILKGMSKDPAQRFQTVAEFIDAVTGGRKRSAKADGADAAGASPERLTGTETIAVSMSAESIQQMLRSYEAKTGGAQAAAAASGGATQSGPVPSSAAMAAGATMQGRLDVAATVAGLDVSKALRASLIFTDGPKKGSRVVIEKSQVMIGSDSSCEVVLAEKSVPRRYALVVERNGDYFAEPLSGEGLHVNGDTVQTNGEGVKLKRGDIINVGNFSLRFVAPGEVFTLQADVADRVIDRPKSRLPALFLMLTVIVAIICGGALYVLEQRKEQQAELDRMREKEKALKREDVVARLLQEGDEFYKAGAFSEPIGANAKEKFEKVLELSPDNTFAKRRIEEIKEREKKLVEEQGRREQFKYEIARLLADGDRYYRNGEYISPPGRNARDLYRQVLDRDPANETAKNRIAEIEKIIGDVLGRVGSLLQRAKEYSERGQYVLPKGENAYEVIQEVLKVDPGNEEAKNYLLDMAARSIYEGDLAKTRVQPKVVKQKYLTAKALGVDPEFIAERMQGIELMGRSQSSVIIVNRNAAENACKKDQDSRFLNCEELVRRVASIALNAKGDELDAPNTGRQYHDIGGGGSR